MILTTFETLNFFKELVAETVDFSMFIDIFLRLFDVLDVAVSGRSGVFKALIGWVADPDPESLGVAVNLDLEEGLSLIGATPFGGFCAMTAGLNVPSLADTLAEP